MKIKKIIILLVIVFLASGCSVEYNLKVDENSITETIYSYYEDTSDNKVLVNRLKNQKTAAFYDSDSNESKYYDVENGQSDNLLYLRYEYKYLTHDLQYSNAVSSCFSNKSVVKDQRYITISTSDGVSCIYKDEDLQIESLKINISTNYKVVENNADKVNNNTYTWNVNKDNFLEKYIYIKMDYTKDVHSKNNTISNKIIIIVLGSLVLGATILIIYLEIRRKKNYE